MHIAMKFVFRIPNRVKKCKMYKPLYNKVKIYYYETITIIIIK